jgi:molecular chaperone DnaK
VSEKIQKILNEVANIAAQRLSEWLPSVGGNTWWQFYVYQQLSIPQQKIVNESDGKITDLDNAAIFKVLSKNWRELSNHTFTKIRASEFKYAKEALDIRNDLAHQPIGLKISLQDALRYLDSLKRLSTCLNADKELVTEIDELYNFYIITSVKGDSSSKDKTDSTENLEFNLVSRKQSPQEKIIKTTKASSSQNNFSLTDFKNPSVVQKLEKTIYIGIDFGTSTTVVSVVKFQPINSSTEINPIAIEQPTEYGDYIEHHLINSVLTKHNNKILFGTEAARLKVKYIEGVDVFSSFKMMLGLNLPNRYPNSKFIGKFIEKRITTPQEVTTEFFHYLYQAIEKFISRQTNIVEVKYAISVPASFEANQRQDLLSCLNKAGFTIESSSLIDEPNAAFLSYLYDCWEKNSNFIKNIPETKDKKILVFDFGAGTCDISILQLKVHGSTVSSRNLSISRFMALGGDDIDRVIAKKYLLPAVVYSDITFSPTQKDLDEKIIPWLKPAAEELKIACTNELIHLQINSFITAKNIEYDATVSTPDTLKIEDIEVIINKPTISLRDYVEAVESFTLSKSFEEQDEDGEQIVGEPKSVIAPIFNAIAKANLNIDDIDSVLFIGGSAKNPLIRSAVLEVFPSNIEALVPNDLQTHVSKGAALHCLGHYALNQDFVRPITSEPIYLITQGASYKLIMPAGSAVPSDSLFLEKVHVARTGQKSIELPICVSNENKLLGMLRLDAPNSEGFKKDEEITLSCRLTHDKLLKASASIRGETKEAILTNPLSNKELTDTEQKIIEAKQIFQEALLANNGRPTSAMLLAYAEALKNSENFLDAADHYLQLESLNQSNQATNICYCYSMGGNKKESEKWAKIAYDRKKNQTTCFNFALQFRGSDDAKCEALLRESLSYDLKYSPALKMLGEILMVAGSNSGAEYLEQAADSLADLVRLRIADLRDCEQLYLLAERLGRDDLVNLAKGRKALLNKTKRAYSEDNLAASGNNIINN